MAGFLRLLLGIVLLPACWSVSLVFVDSLPFAVGSDEGVPTGGLSLLGGMVAFLVGWFVLPHPVKTYVLGHELTHALWGLFFGARPSRLRVSGQGGSVNLTKTNLLITLAPYFFPFYTFVVIVAALVTGLIVRPQPLPWLPLWLFLIGLTWAFHVLFTIDTLAHAQPDVRTYGRIFSWVFIFLANVFLILLWLAATTSLTFSTLFDLLSARLSGVYADVFAAAGAVYHYLVGVIE